MKSIPRNVKIIVSAFLPLIGLVLLSIFAFKFGFGKISEVRTKLSQGKSDLSILQTKLDLLKKVQASVSVSSNLVTVALPSENPVLTVLSQLRELSSQNGVGFENAKTGSETKDASGLSRVDITFDVNGSRNQIFQFLASIPKMSPISLIDKVKLSESGGSGRATIVVKSFWAELPSKLPAVNQGISDFTPDEVKTITDISNLTQPTFTEVTPASGSGKTDPFAF